MALFSRHDLVAFASEELTVSNAVKTLTAATYAGNTSRPGAYAALVTLDATNGLTYTEDGSTPAASTGTSVAGSGQFVVEGAGNVANLKMIRSGGADAVVNVTYYYR